MVPFGDPGAEVPHYHRKQRRVTLRVLLLLGAKQRLTVDFDFDVAVGRVVAAGV